MTPIHVLLNRGGGTIQADPSIAGKVAEALEQAGLDVDIELIDGGDCEVRCRAISERGDALLIVGGGDGTISAAASALVGTGTRLGILPLGTLNHFARDLGIPADLDEAAALIASGKERRVDVGEMNQRLFINNSAIGLYPLMVIDRDRQQEKLGRSKRLAMVVASASHAGALQPSPTDADGQRGADGAASIRRCCSSETTTIGWTWSAPGQREKLDGGELCVLVMRKKTRRGFLVASLRAFIGRRRRDDMVRLEGVERLRVSSPRSQLVVSLDGEVVSGKPPLDYGIRKGALRVIAP